MDSSEDNRSTESNESAEKVSISCSQLLCLPQKRFYRQRAHSNPIADHCFDYPLTPDSMDWSTHYPNIDRTDSAGVEFADIGCGYGGLLVQLAPLFPKTLMLGLEIRVKVCDFVCDRIRALRQQNEGKYENISCLRTNAMKYLPNLFHKNQLQKMFFLFPDPHFKAQKHKWRIISAQLLSEYAYCLATNGLLYIATDVQQLYQWMTDHIRAHPLFESLDQTETDNDLCVAKLFDCTEEGQKVSRKGGQKFVAVFRRIEDKANH